MWQVGVWDGDEGLAELVAALAGGHLALVRGGRHPAHLAGRRFDLLVVSPRASGWAGAGALCCRTALVPGGCSALTRLLPAGNAVSYGLAPSNTLTISGMDHRSAAVAVQREFVTLGGRAMERQELIFPYDGGPPEPFLALAGAALLLDLRP